MRRKIADRGYRPLRHEQLEARCMLDASGLRITEFLASNDDILEDFEGDSSDWIEIYNPSATTVDLEGLYLTDDSDDLTKWRFPTGQSIEPGGFLLVFASDKDTVAPNGELHTNFKISADGEYLGLVAADGHTVIDAYAPEFPPQVEDVSYGLTMTSFQTTLAAEGASARAWVPTSGIYDATWTDVAFDDSVFDVPGASGFGYENSPTGTPSYVGEYNTAVPSGTAGLYVRVPFDVNSLAGIKQLTLRMKYDDGFVAYLNGVEMASANAPTTKAWNSTATSIHDDFDAIVFQEYDVSTAISSLNEGDNVLAIHALNFSAGSSDFLVVPELVASQATIVSPEVVGYFDVPTPGHGNGESFAGFVAEPTFSVPHGFYSSPQQVALASNTSGAVIVYTTDGSTPAVDQNLTPTEGQAYSDPITVTGTTIIRAIAFKQYYKPSFVQSSSYLYLDDVITQSPSEEAPAGWPDYNVNGQLIDYGIDPDIIAEYGEQAVKDSLESIPSITLTTDVENLFDPSTGIYVNALNRGRQWERPASVELIYPDGTDGFSTNAGLRIRGGYHRNNFNPKHAFRLYFRSEYGDGLLDYPLFGDEGADQFDVLDLRTSQNYSWAAWGDTVNGLQNSFLREVFARDAQSDLGQPYTRSRYYHLYVDGQYWGLYMTQERIQEHYGETYFGGDQADYDVVKSDPFESGGTEIADGDDVAWRQLFEMAQVLADNPAGAADNYWAMQGLNPDGTRNDNLPVLLDVDNLIDYMMIIIYTGGHDTGISAFFGNQRANNWFGIRNRETGDQGFQFFLHDNEHSLGAGELVGTLHGTFDIDRTGPFYGPNDDAFEYFNPVYLHQDLLVHPEYTQRFVDRVQELMFDDGPLTVDANIARMTERKDQVEPAIIAATARWGDATRSAPYTKDEWDAEVEWLLDTYFPLRGDMVIEQLSNDGLYNQFGAPVFSQLGGEVPYGYPLQLTTSEGTIYYSLDGASDPRQIGGGVNPSTEVQAYSKPIILTEVTTVWARLLEPSGQWSGLVKATFSVRDLLGDYDGNGLVEQADYSLWRATYGSTTDLRADGNYDGRVDAADYGVWRNNLGQQPTVVTPAAASPSIVTGVSTNLSVLGDIARGDEHLTYTWTVTGPTGVSFSSNGDNASKSTTATFSRAGEYVFTAAIENTTNEASTTSSVSVTVEQVASGVTISPTDAVVAAGTTLQVSAFETDQFGVPVGALNGAVWSVASGGGSVTAAGLYSAPAASGTATIHVESPSGGADAVIHIVAPVAWYQADASSGTTLADSSSGGNTGMVTGSAGWLPGVGGNALSLSGGRANLPDGIVSGLNDFTIATWFYLNSVGTWSRIFDFGSGTSVNMFLTPQAISTGGPLRFAITVGGGGANEQQIDGPSLSAGQWYHVAITLAGDTGTMYLNGLPVGTNSNMTLSPSDLGATTQNYFGDSQYSADPALLGKIDDFRIYPEALPPEQILRMARPVVVSPAAAADDPVTALSTSLSVLGDDLTAGESALVYSWDAVGVPPAPVTFSSNDSNAAKNTTATFEADGVYDLQATITNPTTGLTATSLVSVEVRLTFPGDSSGGSVVDAPARVSLALSVTSSGGPDSATNGSTVSADVQRFAFALIPDGPERESETPIGEDAREAALQDDLLLVHLTSARTPANAFDAESWILEEEPALRVTNELLDTMFERGIQEIIANSMIDELVVRWPGITG